MEGKIFNIKSARIILVFLVAASFLYFTSQDVKTSISNIKNREAFEAAAKLPEVGVLKMKRDGYIYLKVDDRYIHELYSYFRNEGIKKPEYFREFDSPGAHISVLYAEDRSDLPRFIPELEEKFNFKPQRFESITKKNGTVYYILVVESKELEDFRQKYGLSPKLFGHDFHITFGVKKSPHKTFHKRRSSPVKILEPAGI